MDIGLLVVVLFCLGVYALIIFVIASPLLLIDVLTKKAGRIPTKRDHEILADMKATRLSIIEISTEEILLGGRMVLSPSNDDDYLNKFDAPKTKRKQSPSSRATPMVRSKRRRK